MHTRLFSIRAIQVFSLLLALLLLGGCELGLGGPESVASKYVRSLVEQQENEPERTRAYEFLPNRVVIEYARALHAQGVEQVYRTSRLEDEDDIVEIAVIIEPKRVVTFNEREHMLIVELRRDSKQGWSVTGLKAAP